MRLAYFGFSVAGSSHTAGSIGCQDSHYAKIIGNSSGKTVIAAVADGMGSEMYRRSHAGSKTAATATVDYISEHHEPTLSTHALEQLIVEAFGYALNRLQKRALFEGFELEDYSTTLTVAVFTKNCLVFGQVGDGGIIGLDKTGTFHKITEQQKGEFCNQTNSLNTGLEHLVVGSVAEKLCAVLLMTDGIYEFICEDVMSQHDPPLRASFLRSFMDNGVLELKSQSQASDISTAMTAYFSTGEGVKATTDDITMLGIIDTEQTPAKREASYYDMGYLENALNSQERGVYKLPDAKRVQPEKKLLETTKSANEDTSKVDRMSIASRKSKRPCRQQRRQTLRDHIVNTVNKSLALFKNEATEDKAQAATPNEGNPVTPPDTIKSGEDSNEA
jgi:serine/threonine protein phosphatase PrpC